MLRLFIKIRPDKKSITKKSRLIKNSPSKKIYFKKLDKKKADPK